MKNVNNLKDLSDQELNQRLAKLVGEERKLTAEILEHLREVDERQLFLKLAYSSLFAYCVAELHYSEAQAHRRISSMRLLKTLPKEAQKDFQEKIINGSLSLTNLAQAQQFLQNESRNFEKMEKTKKNETNTQNNQTENFTC